MAENTTQELPQKTFYYHADASPIGGTINRPFSGFVPSHTSLSLPLVGGFVEKQRKGRAWKNIVTYSNESAHVSGSRKDEAEDGPWTTQVSATIEHLNILEVVTADKVVAQLSVAHPFDGGHPTISVVGSQFINLRISGQLIEPVIKYDLFADHDSSSDPDPKKRYPKQAWPKQQQFLDKVEKQLTDAKDTFNRKRPFEITKKTKLFVPIESTPSYPSGHSTRATLWALVLAQIFPDQKDALMARARQVGDDRVLGGVHFPSDVEAGRKLAAAIADQMLTDPDFQSQLAAAKTECLAKQKSPHPNN